MRTLRTFRLLRHNPLQLPPARLVRLRPQGRVVSAGAAVRRSPLGSRSARTAAPGSRADSSRDAFMAGQSSPALRGDVEKFDGLGVFKKKPPDRPRSMPLF